MRRIAIENGIDDLQITVGQRRVFDPRQIGEQGLSIQLV